ncbi:epoxide hydrolase family protein [Phytomonospora sp. NPDC050363]|uniref:epoxide hydrolase family protein n=1 Tax=Phytomonospora sp. NPDC050363 TaxID=3155642 RepID=UPI0033F9CBAE
MEPFRIDVPEAVLEDLRLRLEATRFPSRTPGEPWSAGTDPDYLRELVEYWAGNFDWRAKEAWLAGFPQFLADIGGQTVHFAHVRGAGVPGGPPPMPLVVTHGWPYSFADMLPIVSLLADPGAHGGDPADAFDVVVPSLPGYGWSSAPEGPVIGPATADVWAGLMALLGYERFGTYGEDVGAGVSDWLAARHAERVIGVHAAHPAYPPDERRTELTSEERKFLDWLKNRWAGGEGYSQIQSTRPDTLAAGLLDSPSGLAAWISEKFRAWSDGDRFTYDDILTTVMIYWVTGTIGTSFRAYHDDRFEPVLPVITVPAGISVSRADLGMPRSLAERTYADIRFWNDLPAGGHFVAKEEPELVTADVREFFRGLR